jgi:UDP-GlcNAc:undecaprenyl-phosphate GlcNAc-1-phosphate transferase
MTLVASAFLISMLFSVLLTPLMRMISLRLGLVDVPGDRKRHRLETPLLGGVAIFVSFAVAIAAGLLLWPNISEGRIADTPLDWQSLGIMVLAGGFLMMLAGLTDDLMDIKPRWKLILHTVSALLVGIYFVVKGAQLRLFLHGSGLAWLAVPVTVFWLVGITNSFNLLDHADGLASGTATIAALFFALMNILNGNFAVGFVSAAVAGSSLGFLVYNYNPASVFMGDCGSNLLGFMLGLIAVLGVYTPAGSIRELAVLTPVLVLAVPIVDTLLVVGYRKAKGAPLMKADRNHLAHRLMRIGLTHRESVVLLYVMAFLLGVLALLLPTLAPYQAVLIFVHALGVVWLLTFFIRKGEKSRNG